MTGRKKNVRRKDSTRKINRPDTSGRKRMAKRTRPSHGRGSNGKSPSMEPKGPRRDRKPKGKKTPYSGIRHPGSLTTLGYHIQEPAAKKDAALKKAVRKYGRNKVMQKLGDLVRLDSNKPVLKAKLKRDMEFVRKQPKDTEAR